MGRALDRQPTSLTTDRRGGLVEGFGSERCYSFRSREVPQQQQQVARALQEMVGMDVAEIEIHIEDIDYEEIEAKTA